MQNLYSNKERLVETKVSIQCQTNRSDAKFGRTRRSRRNFSDLNSRLFYIRTPQIETPGRAEIALYIRNFRSLKAKLQRILQAEEITHFYKKFDRKG